VTDGANGDADGDPDHSDHQASTAPVEEVEDVVPAVGAVVVDRADGDAGGDDTATRQDRVLVVRDRGREAWAVPFGRVEPGESVRETVRRELQEEVSIQVRVDRLAGVYSAPDTQVFEHRSGRVLQFVTTLVVCSPVDAADPTPDGVENDRARFVPRDALPEMGFVGEWVRSALAGETTLR